MADRVLRSVRALVFMVVACAALAVAASSAASLPPVGGQLQYYGGRVVSNIRVVQVLWGADALVGAMSPAFYQAIVGSPYLGWLNTDYGTTNPAPWVGSIKTDQTIGLGSYDGAGPYTITPSNTQTTVTDSDIQTELSAQITAGNLPAPTSDAAGNNNTYYAISFPSTVTITLGGGAHSCIDFGAYHGAVADVGGGYGEVYYGVFPNCSYQTANDETTAASHELVETITDPEGALSTAVYPNASPPNAWYGFGSVGSFVVGPETADLCEAWPPARLDGTGFAVSLAWSNSANACILTLPAPITTSTSQSFTLGVPGAFTITTSDPSMTFAKSQRFSALPTGVSFVDNHDGTATVAGTPF